MLFALGLTFWELAFRLTGAAAGLDLLSGFSLHLPGFLRHFAFDLQLFLLSLPCLLTLAGRLVGIGSAAAGLFVDLFRLPGPFCLRAGFWPAFGKGGLAAVE